MGDIDRVYVSTCISPQFVYYPTHTRRAEGTCQAFRKACCMFGVVCPDQEGTQILMIDNTLKNDDYKAVNQISDLASLVVFIQFHVDRRFIAYPIC